MRKDNACGKPILNLESAIATRNANTVRRSAPTGHECHRDRHRTLKSTLATLPHTRPLKHGAMRTPSHRRPIMPTPDDGSPALPLLHLDNAPAGQPERNKVNVSCELRNHFRPEHSGFTMTEQTSAPRCMSSSAWRARFGLATTINSRQRERVSPSNARPLYPGTIRPTRHTGERRKTRFPDPPSIAP